MSDLLTVHGFEDVWRAPVRSRIVRPSSGASHLGARDDVRARLRRLVARAPEVMVKITGRTRDGAHLKAHLDYVSRKSQLDLDAADGTKVKGRGEVAALAEAWWELARDDSRRRANSPVSLSVVLSMPAGTPELDVRDAARAFAAEMFGDRHDYVFALHTDTPRPHVHLSVCARGHMGGRLNPKKADLESWRQAFARALRDRGVEAEATPRRARGVVRKAERTPVRKLRERVEAGKGPVPVVLKGALVEAGRSAGKAPPAWERAALVRQARIRALYLAQGRLLQAADGPEDRRLGADVEAFVRGMPRVETRRMALVRALREHARRPGKAMDTPERGR